MAPEHWIFLSPHLDDVALSCGGLAWDLAHQGCRVEIWTLMAGFPPDENYSPFAQQNHLAWGLSGAAAIRMRRAEDMAACQVLGARHRHFDWPDAIYRREPSTGAPVVSSNETLFGSPPEGWLVDRIAASLQGEIPDTAQLVFPLGIGGHVDHLAVTLAGEALSHRVYYYPDYPYILKHPNWPARMDKNLAPVPRCLDELALQHWVEAVLAYPSQISAFWEEKSLVYLAYRNYLAGGGGRLWQSITTAHH